MVWRHDGTPRMLRHVSVLAVNGHGPVTLNSLGSELGRTLALTRGTGTNPAARAAHCGATNHRAFGRVRQPC